MRKRLIKKIKRIRRHKRIRAKVVGSKLTPRLNVFRSNQHLYVQLVDDGSHKTLLALNDIKIKAKGKKEKAQRLGEDFAKAALAKGIKKGVFDRGGFKYHGLIKILAEAIKANGFSF
ncbi:50S ribosomal protein L18 [Candidatus Parcubacteria bacterium]|nr:MAG: 50S ribosomal protein L18 [Candidatus Parcubacteria bacterium]